MLKHIMVVACSNVAVIGLMQEMLIEIFKFPMY